VSAGYSGKPLGQKLGLRAGLRCAIHQPPRDYATLVEQPLAGLSFPATGPFDFIHAFVAGQAELTTGLPAWLAQLAPAGMLWVSWPKKRSPRFRDLTEDGVRAQALPLGLVDIKVCAVDADWSALKLVRRKS